MNNQNQFQPINVIFTNTYFCNGVQVQNDQSITNPPQLPQNIFIAQNIPFPLVPLAYNNDQSNIKNSGLYYSNSFLPNQQQFIYDPMNQQINGIKPIQIINKNIDNLNKYNENNFSEERNELNINDSNRKEKQMNENDNDKIDKIKNNNKKQKTALIKPIIIEGNNKCKIILKVIILILKKILIIIIII